MPPKKPTKAPAKKPTSKAESTFQPLPEATPRYVAPAPLRATAAATTSSEADPSWDLAMRFWFAQFWRTILVVIPGTLVLQLILVLLFGAMGVTSAAMEMVVLALTLLLSVALQVAVIRYMLRKKDFKGFTFTLKGRE